MRFFFIFLATGIILAKQDSFSQEPSDSGVEFLIGDYLSDEGGSWSPQLSPLKRPFGIAFDSLDRMYVVELEGGRVHRRDQDGTIKVIAGDGTSGYRGDGGVASHAVFNGMHNCVITTQDQLLISDSWNHCVRRIDLKTEKIDTIAGTRQAGFGGDGGQATGASFDYVMCVSLSTDDQLMHLTDLKNRRIRNVDLRSGVVSTVAGNGEKGVPVDGAPATQSPLVDPRAAASDSSGRLYVLERGGHSLRMVDQNGLVNTVAGSGKRGFQDGKGVEVEFGSPKHLCIDHRDRVYIADDLNGAIRRYDPSSGEVKTVLGRGFGDRRLRLLNPHGVTVHQGYLYVADSSQHRVLRMKIID